MESSIEKIRALGCADAYLITSETNVAYATGFSGDSSQALITERDVFFFTDARYTLQAEKDLQDAVIITTTAPERIPSIAQKLRDAGVGKLAVEKASLPVNDFDAYAKAFRMTEYADISTAVLRLRAVKSEGELEKIRMAAKGNERVLEALVDIIRPGMTELDIRAELIYQINKQGMDCAFAPIVAAGENAAIPHATATERAIKNGDMLTLDFGCKYRGYCSDITRTFGIGAVDEQLKKIYDIVKVAQQNALDASRTERNAARIDAAARDVITQAGYGEYYAHGTGHGVGLDIHELPVLNARSTDVIEPNMAFTIEPGIYVPGLGGVRIEDMCVGGAGSLYEFNKELILIQ